MPERSRRSTTKALVKQPPGGLARTALQVITEIPEEKIWLAGLNRDQTRRAYRRDVGHFVETLGIRSFEELREVSHKRVIAWRRHTVDEEHLRHSTIHANPSTTRLYDKRGYDPEKSASFFANY